MNIRVIDFYQNRHNQEAIAVHEHPKWEFEQWLEKAPGLPRGWWELACLILEDRMEFMKAFWSIRFAYSPGIQTVIRNFFSCVDDLGVYLVKKRGEQYFLPHLVYSMKDHFYHGAPPVTKEGVQKVYHILQHKLPEDYISLMNIHNGFARNSDEGIFPIEQIPEEVHTLYAELFRGLHPMTFEGEPLDPQCLIPFYKKEKESFYQCFHKEWYPEREMGTLGLSLGTHATAEVFKQSVFSSFLNWLIVYLGTDDV